MIDFIDSWHDGIYKSIFFQRHLQAGVWLWGQGHRLRFFIQKSKFCLYYKDWLMSLVVVLRIFNAPRLPRHIEAAAIGMYVYLYSRAFMDHPCTRGAAVCHQAPPCPLYTQPRARRVWARRTNGLKIVSIRAGFKPTISRLKVKCANHYATQPTLVFFVVIVIALKFYLARSHALPLR